MEPGEKVALWIYDESAQRILALPSTHPVSRWVIVGDVMDAQTVPIGLWFHVDYFEERRPQVGEADKIVRYAVKPGQCMIRWDDIYIAQKLAEAEPPKADPRPIPGLYL